MKPEKAKQGGVPRHDPRDKIAGCSGKHLIAISPFYNGLNSIAKKGRGDFLKKKGGDLSGFTPYPDTGNSQLN